MTSRPAPTLFARTAAAPRSLRSIVVPAAIASTLTSVALTLAGAAPHHVLTAFGVSLVAAVALHLMAADRTAGS